MKLLITSPETCHYEYSYLFDYERKEFVGNGISLDLLDYRQFTFGSEWQYLPREIVDYILQILLDTYIVGGNTAWAGKVMFLRKPVFIWFTKRWFGGFKTKDLCRVIHSVSRTVYMVSRVYELLIATDFESYGVIYGFDFHLNIGLTIGTEPWHFCDCIEVVVHDRLPSDNHHVFQTGPKMADVALVEGHFSAGILDASEVYYPPVLIRPRNVFNEYLIGLPIKSNGWRALSNLLRASLGEKCGVFIHTLGDGFDEDGEPTDIPILEEF
jgi:hypothetical protein